ncbi:unnamed protein product [Dibothriocephalus latus]|uniref:Zinc finger Sec23/Sec24-type domain-containing protein n=1 Tax=Dibothriocephalus latus TaxID=60516 RepID=A0A3P7PEV3_DIBLA|nr:unnamed protein product [Dibothriocephalus latus]
MTTEEWDSLHCPISLVNDWNFLPSDGPERAPRPPVNFPINCDPELMRCTLTAMPASSRLQSQCRLPLGLLIHPFRDVNDLPVIQTSVIVRCRSCRTYINPFVKFLDNNRRWRCPVCTLANTLPDEFFYDPASRTYGDPSRKSMRMIVLKDLSETFLPDLNGMVNRINDNLETLTNFLHHLPGEFANTQDTGNCLGFTLQVINHVSCSLSVTTSPIAPPLKSHNINVLPYGLLLRTKAVTGLAASAVVA